MASANNADKKTGRRGMDGNFDDPPRGEGGRHGGSVRSVPHPREPERRLGRVSAAVSERRGPSAGDGDYHHNYYGSSGESADMDFDPRSLRQGARRLEPWHVGPGAGMSTRGGRSSAPGQERNGR